MAQQQQRPPTHQRSEDQARQGRSILITPIVLDRVRDHANGVADIRKLGIAVFQPLLGVVNPGLVPVGVVTQPLIATPQAASVRATALAAANPESVLTVLILVSQPFSLVGFWVLGGLGFLGLGFWVLGF